MFVKCCQSTIYIKIPIKKLLYNIIYSFNIRPPKSSSATRKSHRFAPPRRCVCMPSWQHCLGDLGAGNRITLGKWSFPHPLWMIHWVKSPGAPPGDTVKTPCRRYSWIFIQDMVVFEVQNLSELETFFLAWCSSRIYGNRWRFIPNSMETQLATGCFDPPREDPQPLDAQWPSHMTRYPAAADAARHRPKQRWPPTEWVNPPSILMGISATKIGWTWIKYGDVTQNMTGDFATHWLH